MSRTQDLQEKYGVHLLSGPLPEGMRAESVFGIVYGNAIMGANFVKDFFARVADVTGGRVFGYERATRSAIDGALEELAYKAKQLGANAVVSIDIDVSAMGKSMIMATAYGTAVLANERQERPVQYLNPHPLG